MLVGPIKFTPEGDHYRFEGIAAMDRLFAGVAGITPFVASPTGFATSRSPGFTVGLAFGGGVKLAA
jgi:hypothetical protein